MSSIDVRSDASILDADAVSLILEGKDLPGFDARYLHPPAVVCFKRFHGGYIPQHRSFFEMFFP